MELMLRQLTGDKTRRWPQGRINGEDDGETAFAIAANPADGTIIIRFSKPMDWIGFKAPEAAALRDKLTEKIKELEASSKPRGET